MCDKWAGQRGAGGWGLGGRVKLEAHCRLAGRGLASSSRAPALLQAPLPPPHPTPCGRFSTAVLHSFWSARNVITLVCLQAGRNGAGGHGRERDTPPGAAAAGGAAANAGGAGAGGGGGAGRWHRRQSRWQRCNRRSRSRWSSSCRCCGGRSGCRHGNRGERCRGWRRPWQRRGGPRGRRWCPHQRRLAAAAAAAAAAAGVAVGTAVGAAHRSSCAAARTPSGARADGAQPGCRSAPRADAPGICRLHPRLAALVWPGRGARPAAQRLACRVRAAPRGERESGAGGYRGWSRRCCPGRQAMVGAWCTHVLH